MVRQLKVKFNFLMVLLVAFSLMLTACQPDATTPNEASTGKMTESSSTTEADGETSATMETQTATMEETGTVVSPENTDLNPLPPDPVPMTFAASDGEELQGIFYPAETTDAPLIVLFHWARGDQKDWEAIAYWLQNRGNQVIDPAESPTWRDSSWFPDISPDFSFNVFTFTFRGCDGGCQSFNSQDWRLDVEAAMTYVIGIENVDLSRVLTIGASIGGDGAAYGCHFYNSELGGCQGAFSISPGGYLTVPYAQEVASLDGELIPRPAWCLYSEGDSDSATACQEATSSLYLAVEYSGSLHGMNLITPDVDPNPLDQILEFIHQYLQCDICSV
jgi:hypothetical protein